MRLGLIGAAGFVGQRVLARARVAGHQVRALVRRPGALQATEGLEVVIGDAHDPEALEAWVGGLEAVVTVAGPPRQSPLHRAGHDSGAYQQGMRALVTAMERAGVRRLLTVAGAAARLPGERLDFRRAALREVLERAVMPDVIRTKDLECAVVAGSTLRWTIVRPPRVGDGAPGRLLATDRTLAGARGDVEDLASFLVRCASTQEWLRRAPTVATAGR